MSTQLLELGIPVLMAVNMADLLAKNGDHIQIGQLSRELGCEIVEVSALKGTGIQKAAEKAVLLAQQKSAAGAVHRFSARAERVVQDAAGRLNGQVPEEQKRFYAIKLLEQDTEICKQLQSAPDVSAQIREMEETFDDDIESIIANERYVFISSIMKTCMETCGMAKNQKEKRTVSDQIDQFVTNRWLALPFFAAMFLYLLLRPSKTGAILRRGQTGWQELIHNRHCKKAETADRKSVV